MNDRPHAWSRRDALFTIHLFLSLDWQDIQNETHHPVETAVVHFLLLGSPIDSEQYSALKPLALAGFCCSFRLVLTCCLRKPPRLIASTFSLLTTNIMYLKCGLRISKG